MKNFQWLFTASLVIVLISCNDPFYDPSQEENHVETEADILLENLSDDHVEIIEIEDCEYLVFRHYAGTQGYGFMAHKGNCKNPIHCHNQSKILPESE